jgi:hypothetical protein
MHALALQQLPACDAASRVLLAAQVSMVGAGLAPLRQLFQPANAIASRANDN